MDEGARMKNKDRFVKCITDAILSGEYAVGAKLPSERALAEMTDMSKTSVHSGLEELEKTGLVEIKPKSGVYVADFMRTGSILTLNAIVHFNGDRLGIENSLALLELRLAIEGTALRRLAEIATEKDTASLRKRTVEIRACADTDALCEMYFSWHREICSLSRNSFLTLIMNTVHDVSVAFWRRYLELFGQEFAADRLDAFTDLIAAHDGDGAYALLADGIDEYIGRIKNK